MKNILLGIGTFILGACVGGIAGRVDASLGEGVTTASKINIKNNKILSYYTSEKTKYNTLHEQFAGGMYGFWKNVSYYNIMGDNVLIENNLIGMLPIKTNTILKYNYVGGIGGLINCVVKMKTVELNNNIISIFLRLRCFIYRLMIMSDRWSGK